MNVYYLSSRSFLSSLSFLAFLAFLAGAAVGALAVIWIPDQRPPPPCTPQAQGQVKEQALVKEQAQTPPSAPALSAPEQRGETIPTPAPAVQESERVTVKTHTLAESPTLPPVQAPAPAKVQAKAHHKAHYKAKPKPKAPEPAGYWNSGEFAAGLH
jgi:cytoskeletal protein RodZ